LVKEEACVTIQVLRMALPGFRGVKNVRVSSEGEKVLLCRLADPGGHSPEEIATRHDQSFATITAQ
jgi:hypothetical protein